ncbi:MAG: DNA mismatch endonuclease Vsr [Sphingobacteriia bacterium]|nr:DNA mismatch endonuclease Vsr [Sphingobacteriia bacterium]
MKTKSELSNQRSKNMSKIKSKNTMPEIYIRSSLFKTGLRYRVNVANVEGKPDIFFPKQKAAIFIHGCFWHRHDNCVYAYTPKSNIEFWEKKISDNRLRDTLVIEALKKRGISTLIIWECTIKHMKKDPTFHDDIVSTILKWLAIDDRMNLEL